MKRRIFFWLEALKITPAERKTVTALLVLLALLSVCNLGMSPTIPFEGKRYAKLEKQFARRTALMKARNKKMLARYHPPAKPVVPTTMAADTTTPDTTEDEATESQHTATPKQHAERINVNTASLEQLKTLPGIGPAYSKRIIKYRNAHDGFKTIEELKKIKGIGEKRLEKLKPFVKLKDS